MSTRTLKYINTLGQSVDFTDSSSDVFIFELEGLGFSYDNVISDSSYQNVRTIISSKVETNEISGSFEIFKNNNKDIYDFEREVSNILNYDQLLIRNRHQSKGMLVYTNASGVTLFIPAIIKAFVFGEINDEDYLKLPIEIIFERLSNVWYTYNPKIYTFKFKGGDVHKHPFVHPFKHQQPAGYINFGNVQGNDFAKFVLEITGPIGVFNLIVTNNNSGNVKKIVYKSSLTETDSLIIDNFDLTVKKNGIVDIVNIDLETGNSPFFDLMPNNDYTFKLECQEITGSMIMKIYEGWVCV